MMGAPVILRPTSVPPHAPEYHTNVSPVPPPPFAVNFICVTVPAQKLVSEDTDTGAGGAVQLVGGGQLNFAITGTLWQLMPFVIFQSKYPGIASGL